MELVVPLVHQSPGRHDQSALAVGAEHHLLEVEARHDRLARAGVVRQKETQRHLRQHLLVNGADLMGKRLDLGGGHGRHRVVQGRVLDAQRLRGQHEIARVRVVGGGAVVTTFHPDAPEVLGRRHTGVDAAGLLAVDDLDRLTADRVDREHLDRVDTDEADQPHARREVAQAHRFLPSVPHDSPFSSG